MRSFLILSVCFAAFPAWIAVRAFADLYARRRMRSVVTGNVLTAFPKARD